MKKVYAGLIIAAVITLGIWLGGYNFHPRTPELAFAYFGTIVAAIAGAHLIYP